jgi:hypothetical protein
MSAKDKREEEKKKEKEKEIIKEVFNLNLYEFIDEYTDKGSGKMPDCYLRAKKEGLPDLAIEVKTLRRDLDRPVDDKTLDQIQKEAQSGIIEHSLSIRNLHIILKLELPLYKNIPPKRVENHTWNDLKKELDKYKEKWESILDKISDIEKLLESEDEDIYVKDLPPEKKDELRKIIEDIKRQDRKFLEYNITYFTYLYLDIHAEICTEKIKDVKKIIQDNKEEGLKWRIKDFLKTYFSEELGIACPQVSVSEESSENGFIFTIRFIVFWGPEEIEFHIEEIERYVERSKGKFENLRKVKSDKSDKSSHWELLLVKGETGIRDSFKSFVEKLDKELENKGYDCLFYVKEPDSWFGIYHLIIRMDNRMGDDWKTQILGILNKA